MESSRDADVNIEKHNRKRSLFTAARHDVKTRTFSRTKQTEREYSSIQLKIYNSTYIFVQILRITKQQHKKEKYKCTKSIPVLTSMAFLAPGPHFTRSLTHPEVKLDVFRRPKLGKENAISMYFRCSHQDSM